MSVFLYLLGCFFLVVASAYVAKFLSKVANKSIEIPIFLLIIAVIFGPGVYADWDWERHCSAAEMKIFSTTSVDSIYSDILTEQDAQHLLRKGYSLVETRNYSHTESQYPIKKYEIEKDGRVTSQLRQISETRYKIFRYRQRLSGSLEVFGFRAIDADDGNKLFGIHEDYINHGGYIWRWAKRVAGMGGAEYCPKSDGVFDFIITVFPPKL
ncbi:hypothetical protein [Pseudomonas syringae]|uniref:hypothetical protein n=1 Tax=Pseudomonas syringae TaxID=317 RepID=UPI001F3FBC13|nr:hypothetical protein [Pseudomonas syringae]MCF9005328.1 hypothetical protein [Pseudomonas syringae]